MSKIKNGLLPWQQATVDFFIYIFVVYYQSTFTSQGISKTFFWTVSNHTKKLPEMTLKLVEKLF